MLILSNTILLHGENWKGRDPAFHAGSGAGLQQSDTSLIRNPLILFLSGKKAEPLHAGKHPGITKK